MDDYPSYRSNKVPSFVVIQKQIDSLCFDKDDIILGNLVNFSEASRLLYAERLEELNDEENEREEYEKISKESEQQDALQVIEDKRVMDQNGQLYLITALCAL